MSLKQAVNLRTWEPDDSDAKNVNDTKMLSTMAHETPDTVTADNKNVEHVTTAPDPGTLGVRGRN